MKAWSTGEHLPRDKRSNDPIERNRVPYGESLHRKAWKQVKEKEDTLIVLFVVEKVMQVQGIYGSDHVPEVSTFDGSDKDGIDTFYVHNYSPCDLALTLTYLIMGLVDKHTLKFPAIPRDRAIKYKKPKHSSSVISEVVKKRSSCITALVGSEVVRSTYAHVASIILQDISRFYSQVNKVSDIDKGESLSLFTKKRREIFHKYAKSSKKMKTTKTTPTRYRRTTDGQAKQRKKAYAIAHRIKYESSEDERDDSDEDDDDDSSDESVGDMMLVEKLGKEDESESDDDGDYSMEL